MSILTNEEYYSQLTKLYEVYQRDFLKNLPEINKFQKQMDFKEFINIYITAFNANTKAIKYLKQNNINVLDMGINNKDRAIALSIERYFYVLYIDALNEFYTYIKKTNEISDTISSKFSYKIFNKIPNNKFTINYKLDYTNKIKDNYKDNQCHVNNFFKINDQIYNFNIEENVIDAVKAYIPFFLKNIMDNKSLYGEDENYYLNMVVFDMQIERINEALNKLGFNEYTSYVKEFANDLMVNDFKKRTKKARN